MWRSPLAAFGDGGVTGFWASGPVCRNRTPDQDETRIGLGQNVIAQIPLLQGAGPEVLDDDVGLLRQIQKDLGALCGLRRLRVIDFCCVRARSTESGAVEFGLPHVRIGSGWPGASILMTSAPMSPSRRPAKGPEISVPISITRMPSSAPVVNVCLSVLVRKLVVRTLQHRRASSFHARDRAVAATLWR